MCLRIKNEPRLGGPFSDPLSCHGNTSNHSSPCRKLFCSQTDIYEKYNYKEERMIINGSVVSFEYTVSDDNGNVLQSNRGKSPVTYTHGREEIVPGLERGLAGMEVNETKNIRLQPQEAYGQVNPEAFTEVPKEQVPVSELQAGTILSARGSQGEDVSIRVHEIRKETVILDLNHPLAGKNLTFDVKVLDIQPGESE